MAATTGEAIAVAAITEAVTLAAAIPVAADILAAVPQEAVTLAAAIPAAADVLAAVPPEGDALAVVVAILAVAGTDDIPIAVGRQLGTRGSTTSD